MIEPTVVQSGTVQLSETGDPEHEALGAGDVEQREPPLVETDLLVEDVSIDGMCGVY